MLIWNSGTSYARHWEIVEGDDSFLAKLLLSMLGDF